MAVPFEHEYDQEYEHEAMNSPRYDRFDSGRGGEYHPRRVHGIARHSRSANGCSAAAACCLVALLLTAACHADETERAEREAAEAQLSRAGLVLRGSVWEQAGEALLRRRLDASPEARQQVLGLRRSLAALSQETAVQWELSRRRVAALRATLATTEAAADRKEVERQIAEIDRTATAPDKLLSRADAVALLRRLSDLELVLLRDTLDARRRLDELQRVDERLRGDPEVGRALKRLGQTLSSPRRFADAPDELDMAERLVAGDHVVVYGLHQQLRVGMLLGGAPATLGWDSASDQLVLPTTIAQSAAVRLADSEAPVELAPGRKLMARRGVVPEVRLGRHVASDVPCLVLPPEGEDLGGRLGASSLPKLRLRMAPASLRLEIEPAP